MKFHTPGGEGGWVKTQSVKNFTLFYFFYFDGFPFWPINLSQSSDLKNINKFFEKLASGDSVMEIVSIGKSIEGRNINLLKINAEKSELPLVFIDAGKCKIKIGRK